MTTKSNKVVTTSMPLYLATNRGFYRQHSHHLFTANIRHATPFSSFNEAETLFKQLKAAGRTDETRVTDYFAVVAGVIGTNEAVTDRSEEALRVTCGNCGSDSLTVITYRASPHYKCNDCGGMKLLEPLSGTEITLL